MNTVNPDNFNETCEGYVVRACRIANLSEKEVKKVLNGLKWAFDEITMSEARKECEKYIKGEIEFKKE